MCVIQIVPSVSLMFSALKSVYSILYIFILVHLRVNPLSSIFLSQSQFCTSLMTSLVSTRPSFCNYLSASLAAVFLICPVIFFKFCTHHIRYRSFCSGVKPAVNSSNSKNQVLISSSTSRVSNICLAGPPIILCTSFIV